MKRKTRTGLSAVFCSLIFSSFYLFLFTRGVCFESAVSKEVVEPLPKDKPVLQSVPYRKLYWIQAGVFRYPDSMNELKQQLDDLNIHCSEYRKNETLALACGISPDLSVTEKTRSVMEQAGLEWMKQECEMDQTMEGLLEVGKVTEVLEGCTSQP